jgi:hypothetical protein
MILDIRKELLGKEGLEESKEIPESKGFGMMLDVVAKGDADLRADLLESFQIIACSMYAIGYLKAQERSNG